MMGCGVAKMERKEFVADRSMFFIDQVMGEGGFGKVRALWLTLALIPLLFKLFNHN